MNDCERCGEPTLGSICSACRAWEVFGDVEAVESSRPRHVGTGARLDKTIQDYHEEKSDAELDL